MDDDDPRLSTIIHLQFNDENMNEIGTGGPWQKMLESFRNEPEWFFTAHAADMNDPASALLIIRTPGLNSAAGSYLLTPEILTDWYDGNPSPAFRSMDPDTPLLSPILSFLDRKPKIRNVAFHWPYVNHSWDFQTRNSRGVPQKVAELLVLQVPQGQHSACVSLSRDIAAWLWAEKCDKDAEDEPCIAEYFFRGWVDENNSSTDIREYYFLWFWSSLEKRDRFKDPEDSEWDELCGDMYHEHFQLPLEKMMNYGVSVESKFLHITTQDSISRHSRT